MDLPLGLNVEQQALLSLNQLQNRQNALTQESLVWYKYKCKVFPGVLWESEHLVIVTLWCFVQVCDSPLRQRSLLTGSPTRLSPGHHSDTGAPAGLQETEVGTTLGPHEGHMTTGEYWEKHCKTCLYDDNIFTTAAVGSTLPLHFTIHFDCFLHQDIRVSRMWVYVMIHRSHEYFGWVQE